VLGHHFVSKCFCTNLAMVFVYFINKQQVESFSQFLADRANGSAYPTGCACVPLVYCGYTLKRIKLVFGVTLTT